MGYVVLAVLGALSFAFGNITIRRAVIRVADATIGVFITVPLSLVVFTIILLALGQIGDIVSFSWQSYCWLSTAGILHFVVGRSLKYYLAQLVGVNITIILNRISVLVSVFLGITFLGELLSWELAVGVFLIMCGVMLAGMNPQMFRVGQGLFSNIPPKAYLLGLGLGLSWGITPIMIKMGLSGSGPPVVGVFISYMAATIVLGPFLLKRSRKNTLTGMKRGALGYFCITGLFTATAQLMRYMALSLGPVSVIAPIFATGPIFTLLLGFVFNRKLDVFSPNVILGIIFVLVGSILLM